MGTIALVGGNEFRAECMPMDLWLLHHIDVHPVRVVIMPTAAAQDDPMESAENGVRHFSAMKAEVTTAMITDRDSANDPAMAALLNDAHMVYLPGGSPWMLWNILRESVVLDAIWSLYRRGGVIVGSSAGAMALGEKMRQVLAAGWQNGLGFVPNVAVMPHYNRSRNANYEPLRAALDPAITMLGISEATACVHDGGDEWEVVGVEGVTVFTADGMKHYKSGDCFTVIG
jgi:cyanophycinase